MRIVPRRIKEMPAFPLLVGFSRFYVTIPPSHWIFHTYFRFLRLAPACCVLLIAAPDFSRTKFRPPTAVAKICYSWSPSCSENGKKNEKEWYYLAEHSHSGNMMQKKCHLLWFCHHFCRFYMSYCLTCSTNCSFLHLCILCLDISSASDDLKASPGAIEAVIQHPSAADKV